MHKDYCPFYAIALVAGAALAVWAGMPVAFPVFLACPLMMFLMMKGMGMGMGGNARQHARSAVEDRRRALDYIPPGGMLKT